MTKKKLFLILSSAVVMLAVIDIGVGFGMSLYVRHCSIPGDYGKIEHMLKRVKVPVILLGASTCMNSLDPEILEKGTGKKVFNGGLNDQRLEFFNVISEAVLRRSPPPELLILILRHNDLTFSGRGRLAMMNIYYHQGYAKLDHYLNEGKWGQRLLLSSALYRINTFWWRILLYHFKSFNELAHGGFVGKPVPKYPPRLWDITKEKQMLPIIPRKLQCLKDICESCRKAGTRLWIVIPPEYYRCSAGFERCGETYIREFCSKNDIRFINDSHNPDFVGHPEYFFDNNHLNINGAKLYSQRILDLLKKEFAR